MEKNDIDSFIFVVLQPQDHFCHIWMMVIPLGCSKQFVSVVWSEFSELNSFQIPSAITLKMNFLNTFIYRGSMSLSTVSNLLFHSYSTECISADTRGYYWSVGPSIFSRFNFVRFRDSFQVWWPIILEMNFLITFYLSRIHVHHSGHVSSTINIQEKEDISADARGHPGHFSGILYH